VLQLGTGLDRDGADAVGALAPAGTGIEHSPNVLTYFTDTRPTSTPSAAATTRRANRVRTCSLIRQTCLDLNVGTRKEPDPHLDSAITDMPSSQADSRLEKQRAHRGDTDVTGAAPRAASGGRAGNVCNTSF